MINLASDPCTARSAWPLRDLAIVDVLAHCGLRVSELCALSNMVIDQPGELALPATP